MSHELEVIDAETGEAVMGTGPMNLFGTDNPREVVRRATENADALAAVLADKELFSNIKGKRHVLVEGWTLLGSMLGVFPVCVWTRKLEDGWEARVEAKTLAGAIVGAAEAECLRSEARWKSADDYAVRSMAQTRATSKALRQPLGFIVSLAGFQATPAEEMPADDVVQPGQPSDPLPETAAPTDQRTPGQVGLLRELLEALYAQQKRPEPDKPDRTWTDLANGFSQEQFGCDAGDRLTKDQYQQVIEYMRPFLKEGGWSPDLPSSSDIEFAPDLPEVAA